MTNLLKSSPFVVIWSILIIGSFIFAIANRHFVIVLDIKTIILVIPFLVFCSLLSSLKNYDAIPKLIVYSKSKYPNKIIYIMFFIKQAFLNNIILVIFNLLAFYSMSNGKYFLLLFSVTVFSLFLSFSLMYIKNKYMNKKTNEIKNKPKINPQIKSILYDYVSPNFLSMVILSVVLFLIVLVELAKGINSLNEMENQSVFFILMTIILSVGFTGIIESIPNINWKFQAILSPHNYIYYFKRSAFFLSGLFGLLIATFAVIGIIINAALMLKYLFCIFIIFLLSINIAFTILNPLFKALLLSLLIALTIWISTLHNGFLLVLVIPVIKTWLTAKDEYKEWSLS